MPGGRLARELGDRAVFQVAGVMRMADGIANAAPLLANDEAAYRLPTPAPQAAAAPASGLRRSHATAEAEANERGKRRSPAPRRSLFAADGVSSAVADSGALSAKRLRNSVGTTRMKTSRSEPF